MEYARAGAGARLIAAIRTVPYRIKVLRGKEPKVRMLYLEVTHRCNARCVTCYTKAGREKPDALTLDEKKDVVQQAKELGARVVSLSGSGEPLLYPHLFDLIDFVRQLDMQIVMFTNGTVVDKSVAEFLIRNEVITYFKLFSLDPATFDQMTGRTGTYTWVPYSYPWGHSIRDILIPSGLKRLLNAQEAAGAADLVRVESLITKVNHRTLPAVAQLCRERKLILHLETPVFGGRAIENYADVALNAEEYERLYHELVAILGEEYFCELRAHPCPVERNPVVWTNGDIGICSSRPASVGNVRDVSLKTLFVRAQIQKRREDYLLARKATSGRYFRTCPARRYYNAKHNIHLNY